MKQNKKDRRRGKNVKKKIRTSSPDRGRTKEREDQDYKNLPRGKKGGAINCNNRGALSLIGIKFLLRARPAKVHYSNRNGAIGQ